MQASFAVVDAESGRILAEQEAAVKMPPASITKITTVYVALQESTPDEQVRISRNASNQEGSSVYLKKGDVWRLESLLYATMLQSGNDAAVAVAEHVAGSEEAFVELSKFEDSRV
ncbi:D-alanyl-D-alanine carboxypeptidase [Chryseomicrobium aureum]|uniref:serine hydrolase n=1 Tax=Chryseomicrobium aureum TaxID=1441723 RepID=UPI00195A93E5|nr:D-alanyl-D-alanine carboxypeptidase [Chryseomicrobium aureum]